MDPKIYLESLENKLAMLAFSSSGNCSSKCAVSKGLAPGARNLEKTQGSSVTGSLLAKDPADTLAPCP